MISVVGPFHAIVLHQAVVKSGLKSDIIYHNQTTNNQLSFNQLLTHLQADVTDAVTSDKGM